MQRSPPGLLSLPTELLGACLSFLSLQDGPSVTLVCKRLRTLFFEQPSVWRRFELVPPASVDTESKLAQYFAAKLALLRRVAPLVQEFVTLRTDCPTGHVQRRVQPPVADFLPLLPPSLTALDLNPGDGLPPQTVPSLQPLTALRSLRLSWLEDADGLPAALQRMLRLEQLHCLISSCPAGLIESVCQLSGLASLSLSVLAHIPSTQPLTQLAQLRHLALMHFRSVRPPAPAAFPRLQTFCLSGAFPGDMEVAGVRCSCCSLWSVQIGDQELTTLHLEREHTAPAQPLAPLLTAALPPSVDLQALSLSRLTFSAAALQGCTQLTGLQGLKLWQCDGDEAAAAALFSCSTRLSALSLYYLPPQQMGVLFSQPPPQLKSLELADADALPTRLPQLTGLTYLSTRIPELTLADAELLCCLPHLRTLVLNSLDRNAYEHTTAGTLRTLTRRLPNLQVDSTMRRW